MQKNKAIVGVCSAGMKFCGRAEACSPPRARACL